MPYIKKSSVDRILERVHIEEVIADFVDLKKAGANFKGFSPFVTENSPSFIVSPVKKIFKDFASGKGGNVVNFLIEKKGMSYPEAIEYIAKKYNETVEYEPVEFSENKVKQLEEKEKLRKVLTLVHELYKKQYKESALDSLARQEVEGKREYDQETIIDWGIGYAPENFLYDKLNSSGYLKEGAALGLITLSERGNKWDNYSKRVIYPIHDRNGLLIGFGGRDISDNKKAGKWINPKVDNLNVLYNKATVWYGMDKAKMAIRKAGKAYIVEGYNDVIAWHKYGLENTISSCGTAISPTQINEVSKLCKTVVFCMDPDRAGMGAVLKQIPLFIRAGFRTEVLILDLDPDDFSRKYHDLICMSGGLQEMFSQAGVTKDGFTLLINEYIKKDYYELEVKLAEEKIILQQYERDFATGKNNLITKRTELEGDALQAKNLLNEILLTADKKSEKYKEQLKTSTTINGQLDLKKHELKNYVESPEFKQQKNIVSDLSRKLDDAFKYSETKRSAGAQKLCADIIHVQENSYFQIYLNWIQVESKVAKTTLNGWIKELRAENSEEEEDNDYELEYELPKNVKIPFHQLEPSIKNYGMFIANNQVYMALPEGRDGKVYFSSISNFEISVLQHMTDEKYPTKLIRIKNVHNKEVIFDTLSENLNSPQIFYNTMSGHGNFNFKGNNSDLGTLRTYLFDNMGNGKKIEVLGWQPDGNFWAWNNRIITEDGQDLPLDEYGVFVQQDTHYYIASANKIHKFSNNKYNSQKRFKVIENSTSFEVYMAKVKKVHREHAISALLFGMASLFQDIAVDESGNFPILFFYGPGGSGKDELAYIVQSFVGIPQIPINLEGGASTLKAKIIELAQFKNGISQMSEYKRGDPKLDGIIKSIWDRVGYKRGSIESRIAMDTVDIESSVVLTGNDYPNAEPIIIRVIWNEMVKNVFSEQEMKDFDELNDMTEKGISGYSNNLLKFRKQYKEQYSKSFRLWKGILKENFPEAKGRIISNLAVLGSTYQIMRDTAGVLFPFDQNEMITHFRNQIECQLAKIQSASIMVRFWDCFIASLRGHKDDRLQANYIVSIEADTLYMQWTHTLDKIERKWWTQYHEIAPSRATFKDELVKSGVLIEEHKVHSFDRGRGANRSSAISINLNRLSENVKADITGSVNYQLNEGTLWDGHVKKEPDATAQTAMPLDNFKEDTDDEPF